MSWEPGPALSGAEPDPKEIVGIGEGEELPEELGGSPLRLLDPRPEAGGIAIGNVGTDLPTPIPPVDSPTRDGSKIGPDP